MTRPPFIQKGDTIALTAPARWVEEKEISDFIQMIELSGYRLRLGDVYRKNNQFAGTDKERAGEMQSMLDDPDVRAIFCARGGYGSGRIIKQLDLSGFRQYPKWLAGFSDITVLHALLQIRCGVESLHGPMPFNLKDQTEAAWESSKLTMDLLSGTIPEYEFPAHPLNRSGRIEGELTGGNLSMLYSLTGTDLMPDPAGKVLFIEDVDEYLYHIDRMMRSLDAAGAFHGLSGLIVGGMTDMHDNKVPFGSDAFEIIREVVEQYDFPVYFGFPAGHQDSNYPLIMGGKVELEESQGTVKLKFLSDAGAY